MDIFLEILAYSICFLVGGLIYERGYRQGLKSQEERIKRRDAMIDNLQKWARGIGEFYNQSYIDLDGMIKPKGNGNGKGKGKYGNTNKRRNK